jgi:hypothetical protein
MKKVYRVESRHFGNLILRRTDKQVVFSIRGTECILSAALADSSAVLYFHAEEQAGQVVNIVVDTACRPEFSDCPATPLPHLSPVGKRPFSSPESEPAMFENYKISEIEFGTINIVALEAVIEELAKDLDGASLRVKEGDTYLVRDGAAVKLESDEFRGQVEEYVKGKTVVELRKNSAMYKLVTKLGLIKTVTLTRHEEDLVSILS